MKTRTKWGAAGAVVFAAAIALISCVAEAKAPRGATVGAEYAGATFVLGLPDTGGLGYAVMQEYRVGDRQSGEGSERVKTFTWAAKKPKDFLLSTAGRVFIFSTINRIYGAPGLTSSGSNGCQNISSFTPQPFARYRIMQIGNPYDYCELQIVDLATGEQPADLERVPFPVSTVQE